MVMVEVNLEGARWNTGVVEFSVSTVYCDCPNKQLFSVDPFGLWPYRCLVCCKACIFCEVVCIVDSEELYSRLQYVRWLVRFEGVRRFGLEMRQGFYLKGAIVEEHHEGAVRLEPLQKVESG